LGDLRKSRTPDIFRILYTGNNVKYMGLTDLTSNPFIDGMKKIYELEPFINPTVIKGKTPIHEPFLRKSRAI